MATQEKQTEQKRGVTKMQLAVGAASLFLFIVGLKRTFRVEDHHGTPAASDESTPATAGG